MRAYLAKRRRLIYYQCKKTFCPHSRPSYMYKQEEASSYYTPQPPCHEKFYPPAKYYPRKNFSNIPDCEKLSHPAIFFFIPLLEFSRFWDGNRGKGENRDGGGLGMGAMHVYRTPRSSLPPPGILATRTGLKYAQAAALNERKKNEKLNGGI